MTIVLKIFDLKTNDPLDMFNETHKNSLLSFDDNNSKFYFTSLFSVKKEINVYYSIIELNEKFANYLNNFIKKAIIDSQKLSNEPISQWPDTINKVEDAIANTVNLFCHKTNPCIFEFSRDIFIKLLKFHPFLNGNKRFATAFLILILNSFGFHFYWTKGTQENYGVHENIVANFVSELSINKIEQENIILKWIKKNCVIDIPLNGV